MYLFIGYHDICIEINPNHYNIKIILFVQNNGFCRLYLSVKSAVTALEQINSNCASSSLLFSIIL